MVNSNKNNNNLNGNNSNTNEERFEDLLLNWVRTVTIFFIAGIALYHFTRFGKSYTIIAFLLSIVLMVTMIVDYILRRNELTSQGVNIRLPLDIIVAVMMVGTALVLMITWEVIIEPYNTSPFRDLLGKLNEKVSENEMGDASD